MEKCIEISADDFYSLWINTFLTNDDINMNMSDICVYNLDLYLRLIAYGIPPTWYVKITSRNYKTGGFGYWIVWRKNKKSNGKNKSSS